MHHTRKNRSLKKKSKALKKKSNKSNRKSKKSRRVNKRKIRGGGKLSEMDFMKITNDITNNLDSEGNQFENINAKINAFIDATQHIEACNSMFSSKINVNCDKNKFTYYTKRALLGTKLQEELGDVKRNIRVQLITKTEEWDKLAKEKYQKGYPQTGDAENKEDTREKDNQDLHDMIEESGF